MATLAQVQDWRRTPIGYTPLGLHSDPFLTDAAVVAFDQRKEMHKVLDKACCDKGIEQDKAQRMHAALDRLLDSDPDLFNRLFEESDQEESDEEEEPEEEVDEEENVRTHEVSASARDRSVAMDLLDPEENAQIALANLGKKVDLNRPEARPWFQTLWNCAAKLNPVSKIKDMPKTVVDFCMDQIAEG